MLHGFPAVDHTSARGYDRILRCDRCIHPVFYLQKTVLPLFSYDLPEKFPLLFLDQQVSIYKLHPEALCDHNPYCALPYCRHADKYKVFLFMVHYFSSRLQTPLHHSPASVYPSLYFF